MFLLKKEAGRVLQFFLARAKVLLINHILYSA